MLLRAPLAKSILLWLMLCALFNSIATRMPPMQSPDETQHIGRAWMIAHGQWLLNETDGKMSGGRVDPQLYRWAWGMLRGWAGPEAQRTSLAERDEISKLRWSAAPSTGALSAAKPGPQTPEGSAQSPAAAELVFAPVAGTGYYLPLIYLPHAIGLRLGEALDWTIEESYKLARFVVHMLCAALLLAAWQQMGAWRPPAMALGFLALPMSLFQFAAPTIDGLTTGLAVLVISMVARAMVCGLPLSRVQIGALCASLLLLGTTRLHLVPMLAFLPLLAIRLRQASLAWWALVLLLCCGGWTIYAAMNTLDLRIERSLSASNIAMHYLSSPLALLGVLARTLSSSELLQFYLTSFIGVLGWLDTPLLPWQYAILGAGLLLLLVLPFFTQKRPAAMPFFAPTPAATPQADARLWRWTCGVVAMLSIVVIFCALLATWTVHPAVVIEGVQGRYFLVPAILLACAMLPQPFVQMEDPRADAKHAPKTVEASRRPGLMRRALPLALLGFGLCSLWILLSTLQKRYIF